MNNIEKLVLSSSKLNGLTQSNLKEVAEFFQVKIEKEPVVGEAMKKIAIVGKKLIKELKGLVIQDLKKEIESKAGKAGSTLEQYKEKNKLVEDLSQKREQVEYELIKIKKLLGAAKRELKELAPSNEEIQKIENQILELEVGLTPPEKIFKKIKAAGGDHGDQKKKIVETFKGFLNKKKPLKNGTGDSPFFLYGKNGADLDAKQLAGLVAACCLDISLEKATTRVVASGRVDSDMEFEIHLAKNAKILQKGGSTFVILDGVSHSIKNTLSKVSPLQIIRRMANKEIMEFVETNFDPEYTLEVEANTEAE